MGAWIKKWVNSAKTLIVKEADDGVRHFHFWCPACRELHLYNVGGSGDSRPTWTYNGDPERPSFHPSLRYLAPDASGQLTGTRCHLWLRQGVLEFCGDCPHEFKGKTVELQPIPQDVLDYALGT